jgi:hypothetical protein
VATTPDGFCTKDRRTGRSRRASPATIQDRLRDVAAGIWQHLAERRTLTELCALVSEEYDTTPDARRPDVVRFIDELRARNLIDLAGASVSPELQRRACR